MSWPVEEIPSGAALYMRVHKGYLRNGDLIPGVFRDQKQDQSKGGMSTDWNRYSTIEETRGRAKKPEDNGVIELNVVDVRAINSLAVEHTPDWERRNRSHTEVFGEKTTEIRLKLSRVFTWKLRL